MLHEFLSTRREELISRCREKVARRRAPMPTATELLHGIPLFLDQLTDTLREEAASGSHNGLGVPVVARAVRQRSRSIELETTAGRHGNELLLKGYTVDQVVHDYGDLCQAVTELALEENAAITTEEFRTLNRCLDNAIADAVTEFERQRDHRISGENAEVMNIRLGLLAHELSTLTTNAMLAVAAIKKGNVGVAGATGAVLDRSLMRLQALVDRALVEVRLTAGMPERRERVALAKFIAEVQVVAAIEAEAQGLELTVTPVEPALRVEADRHVLAGAVANLLQNAFKFTRPHGRILLRGYSAVDRILIEVEDECGGLASGKTESMLRPSEHVSVESTGLGLGLVISRRAVEANGGILRVRNRAGVGCIFTIDLPQSPSPTSS
jgi:signal transduction histidine kinase